MICRNRYIVDPVRSCSGSTLWEREIMGHDIAVTCACGGFRAVIRDVSERTGNHAICYCVDCRAYARHLGQEARILDESGGTDLYQTQPWQVEIREGRDQLAVLQLARKGLYRWYARCCDTPICNTMGTPKLSFAGFTTANFDVSSDALGPVLLHYKADYATGPVPEDKGSMMRLMYRTMRNALRSRLNGKWRKTPFFDAATGRSIVKPHVLSDVERTAAYAE